MTTDVFIAGLMGMTLIALLVVAITFRRTPLNTARRDQDNSAVLRKK